MYMTASQSELGIDVWACELAKLRITSVLICALVSGLQQDLEK